MGFEENIAAIKLSGHVKVELFDELTRKKILETEGHNMFTNYGLSRFRRMSGLIIGGQFAANQWFNEATSNRPYPNEEGDYAKIDDSSFGFLKYLLLTDNEAPVTAADVLIPGNITGIGERYSSRSESLYGSLNLTETAFFPGTLKVVFDFATDRANGIHKSLFWATQSSNDNYDSFYQFLPLSETVPFPKGNYYCFVESGGYLYAVADSKIYKLDLSTYNTVDTYPLPGGSWSSSNTLCVEGNTAVVTQGSSGYILNLTTKEITSFSESTMNNCKGTALLGGYLYYTYWGTLYKMDLSTKTKQSISVDSMDDNLGCLRLGNSLVIRKSNDLSVGTIDFNTKTFSVLGKIVTVRSDQYAQGGSETLGYLLWSMQLASYQGGSAYVRGVPRKIDLTRPAKANLITGKLLDTPVTKNNTQTMKVTYTINIV